MEHHAVVEAPQETRSIFPAVLDYLGVDGAPPSEKEQAPFALWDSLVDMAENESAPKAEAAAPVFSIVWLPDAPRRSGKRVKMASLRKGNWKLIRDITRGRDCLYDLAEDPLEMRDVAHAHSQRVISMREGIDAWLELTSRAGGPSATRPLTPEERRRLKALGYL
jgi:hypothetical protein